MSNPTPKKPKEPTFEEVIVNHSTDELNRLCDELAAEVNVHALAYEAARKKLTAVRSLLASRMIRRVSKAS